MIKKPKGILVSNNNGRSDVTVGSTWATTSAQLLQPPTALEVEREEER